MTITRGMIQAMAGSRRAFEDGNYIFKTGQIKLQSAKSFWKNEIKVIAEAYNEHETVKQVNLTISSGKIISSRCSCLNPDSRKGLCCHAVAAALTWLELSENQEVESEHFVGPMIEAYGQLRQTEILADYIAQTQQIQEQVHIMPYLALREVNTGAGSGMSAGMYSGKSAGISSGRTLEAVKPMKNSQRLALSLKIGSGKYYKVKDISTLIETFRQGNRYLYGKYLDFYHVPEAFDRESLQLLETLTEIHDRINGNSSQSPFDISFRNSVYSRDGSALLIGQDDMDTIIESFSDPLVESEEELSFAGYLEIVHENPQIELVMRYRSSMDPKLGIYMVLRQKLQIFPGKRHLYIIEKEKMKVADSTYSRYMRPFLTGITQEQEDTDTAIRIRIAGRDMPGFCMNVLPVLEKYTKLDHGEVDISLYETGTLRTEFFFDLKDQMEVTLEIVHHYGKESFNPILGENPAVAWRDRAKEKKIALLASSYFERRYPDKGLLTTYGDNQMALRLAAGGYADFAALGEVYLSEALQHIKIRKPSGLHFHVESFSDWLELSIDMDGLTREELVEILKRYEEKRNWYQMKDGSYVMLDHQELDILPELMEGLQISAEDLSGPIKNISESRSLYLKKIFEAYQKDYTHDTYFEKLTNCLEHHDQAPAPVPDGFEKLLREYQIKGYQWMAMLDRMGFGGILADDMGLGKTLQTITLLQHIYYGTYANNQSGKNNECSIDNECRKNSGCSMDNECSRNSGYSMDNECRKNSGCSMDNECSSNDECSRLPSLIVCPSSLVYNWEHEIARFAPDLKTAVIVGLGRERKEQLAELKANEEAQVWITSYDLLRRDIEQYKDCRFRLQVLDEAQYIKNQGTQNARVVKKIQAVRRFALTGTPVENRLGELWSIFDYLMPGFLYSYNRFKLLFENPITKDQDDKVINRLHNLIAPFILRRLKKDVLADLPDKCDKILYPTLEGEQKKLYTAYAYQLKKALEHETDDSFRKNRTTILAGLTHLRELCCAPSLVYEDFTAENAKMEALMELIHTCLAGGHRILIFSQFARMLRLIEQRLYQEKIPCFKLTGQTGKQERQHLVERFSDGEVPIFLISLKAGGTGLNLTQADTVIHYDPWWNVAAQNQATDRAHRIGQTQEVNVYRLIAANTIEENILKLQESKQNLVEQVLSGKHVNLAEMSREELLQLL